MRSVLTQHFTDEELTSWFDPLSIDQDRADSLTVTFPHAYFQEWFNAEKRQRFEEGIHASISEEILFVYKNSAFSVLTGFQLPDMGNETPFGSNFTLNRFLYNKKNYLSLFIIKQINDKEKSTYNPLCIYGKTGTGKTHLLRAIGNDVVKKRIGRKPLLFTPDSFCEFYSEYGAKGIHEARKYILSHDMLLIDDMHRMVLFSHYQDELAMIIDRYLSEKKQVVTTFSLDELPKGSLTSRLRMRLAAGLRVDIAPPDLDILSKYFSYLCRKSRIRLPKERIISLARRYGSIPELQGILLKLQAAADIIPHEIDEKDYSRILEHLDDKRVAPLTVQRVMRVVAEHFHLSEQDLVSGDRHHSLSQARQIALYICRRELRLSFPRLGALFGGRDHSTVLYAVKKIARDMESDPDLDTLVTELTNACIRGQTGERS